MSWELFHTVPIGIVLQHKHQRQFNNFMFCPFQCSKNWAGVPSDMPPAPRRAAPDRNMSEVIHLAFTRATNQGNFVAIMRESRLAASTVKHSDSESIFAQGLKLGQTTWDDHELGRILHNGTTISKNECGVVFLGLAWGAGKAVHQGREGQRISMTKPGGHGCVHQSVDECGWFPRDPTCYKAWHVTLKRRSLAPFSSDVLWSFLFLRRCFPGDHNLRFPLYFYELGNLSHGRVQMVWNIILLLAVLPVK